MSLLLSIIENGVPDQKCKLPHKLKDYYQFREHLYSVDGVILYKDRIVIPPSLCQDCLLALHAAHQGTSAMVSSSAETTNRFFDHSIGMALFDSLKHNSNIR